MALNQTTIQERDDEDLSALQASSRTAGRRLLRASSEKEFRAKLLRARNRYADFAIVKIFPAVVRYMPARYTENIANGIELESSMAPSMSELLLAHPDVAPVDAVEERIRFYTQHCRAPNTIRRWHTQWNLALAFCDQRNMQPFPMNWYTAASLMVAMADSGYGYGSIANMRSTIAVAHQFGRLEDPTRDPRFIRVVAGIARVIGTDSRYAKQAIVRDDLLKMYDVAKAQGDLQSLLDWSMILTGYSFKLRCSELVAARVELLRTNRDHSIITLRLPRTKSSQTKAQEVSATREEDERLCPVRTLMIWLRVTKRTEGPLFSVTRGMGLSDNPISKQSYHRTVKRYCESIGLDPKEFGTHSLRAGNITQQLDDGKADVKVAMEARHKDFNTLLRYYRPRNTSRYVTEELYGES